MSVIKSKRSLSEMEFFHNALVLRRAIATLLLRDFGVKDKCRSVKLFEHLAKISDEDKKVIEPIFEKYNIVSAELGLTLSSNKTQIKKLKTGFTFLKIKYSVTDSGHIVKRICSSNVTRQRRKLKKLKAKVMTGRIPFVDVLNMHKSWIGGLKKFDSHRTLQNMQDLFNSLFKKELENYERKRKTRTGNPKFNVPAEFQLITDWRLENRKISGVPGGRPNGSL